MIFLVYIEGEVQFSLLNSFTHARNASYEEGEDSWKVNEISISGCLPGSIDLLKTTGEINHV
jgi:hypothetical protein